MLHTNDICFWDLKPDKFCHILSLFLFSIYTRMYVSVTCRRHFGEAVRHLAQPLWGSKCPLEQFSNDFQFYQKSPQNYSRWFSEPWRGHTRWLKKPPKAVFRRLPEVTWKSLWGPFLASPRFRTAPDMTGAKVSSENHGFHYLRFSVSMVGPGMEPLQIKKLNLYIASCPQLLSPWINTKISITEGGSNEILVFLKRLCMLGTCIQLTFIPLQPLVK